MDRPLTGRLALVAGATRGAGRAIAVELARAGAFVHATGRSSRARGASEIGRPETIEETGDLVADVGEGRAHVVDHEDPDEVAALVAGIDTDHGRLDVLVNDAFGGDRYAQWDKPLWEHDLDGGWRMLGMGVRTHLVTLHHALPLMLRDRPADDPGLVVEMTDGTAEPNRDFRRGVGFYYDLVKANVARIVTGLAAELEGHPGRRSRRDAGLAPLGGHARQLRRHRGVLARGLRAVPEFAISESPTYVARGVAALAAAGDGGRWAGEVVSARQLADAYGLTDADGSRPDCWGHLARFGWVPRGRGRHRRDARLPVGLRVRTGARGREARSPVPDRSHRRGPCSDGREHAVLPSPRGWSRPRDTCRMVGNSRRSGP